MPNLRISRNIPELRIKGDDQIVVAHLSTPLSWRGGEQQAAYLIEEMAKKEGIHQVVICSVGSAMEKWCEKNNIEHVSVKKRSAFDLLFARQVSVICKKLDISLVHVHDSHAHTFAVLSSIFFGNQTPLIISRRVDFPVKKSWFSRLKYNHSSIKKIICVSDKIREVMMPAIKDKKKLLTIHSSIDIDRFKNGSTGILRKTWNVAEDKLLIGNVAAIAPHKDYFTFVDTVDILVKRGLNAKYFIIGAGPEEKQIREYVKQKQLTDHITFTGFLNNIPEVLPELDVFLFTSKTEGLGTSLLDAFAAGVPVVATAAGGVPEIVKHEKSGLLVPVKSPEMLADNVLRLVNDVVLKEKIIAGGKELLKDFTRERMADRFLEIYREITLQQDVV